MKYFALENNYSSFQHKCWGQKYNCFLLIHYCLDHPTLDNDASNLSTCVHVRRDWWARWGGGQYIVPITAHPHNAMDSATHVCLRVSIHTHILYTPHPRLLTVYIIMRYGSWKNGVFFSFSTEFWSLVSLSVQNLVKKVEILEIHYY